MFVPPTVFARFIQFKSVNIMLYASNPVAPATEYAYKFFLKGSFSCPGEAYNRDYGRFGPFLHFFSPPCVGHLSPNTFLKQRLSAFRHCSFNRLYFFRRSFPSFVSLEPIFLSA